VSNRGGLCCRDGGYRNGRITGQVRPARTLPGLGERIPREFPQLQGLMNTMISTTVVQLTAPKPTSSTIEYALL